jgi:hypothetical protein
MSLQHTLALVRRHYVFWEKEFHRASADEQPDCEFFHQQVQDEIVSLERQLKAETMYPLVLHEPQQPTAAFSKSRPPTRKIRGRSLR